MKVSELSGAQLDWAVGEAQGLAVIASFGPLWRSEFAPSIRWAQAGPIIEREGISILVEDDTWKASNSWGHIPLEGPTPLVAAMRCYVASKLGNEVDLPVEIRDHKKGCPAIDGFGCKCEEIKNV